MKSTNDNIKKSWRDVSINEYFELRDTLAQLENEYEKEIYLISFINGISEDDVYNMPISKVKYLQSQMSWLSNVDISPDVKFKKISINDSKYKIDVDLQNFTIGQYIDFQTFYPKRNNTTNYIGNLLACFIIPKGHKYNTDYNIQEVIDDINNKVDILTANEIIFFFLKQYLISIKALQSYFNWQMKILKKIAPKKSQEKIKKLQENWDKMQRDISAGLPLLTMSQS